MNCVNEDLKKFEDKLSNYCFVADKKKATGQLHSMLAKLLRKMDFTMREMEISEFHNELQEMNSKMKLLGEQNSEIKSSSRKRLLDENSNQNSKSSSGPFSKKPKITPMAQGKALTLKSSLESSSSKSHFGPRGRAVKGLRTGKHLRIIFPLVNDPSSSEKETSSEDEPDEVQEDEV